MRTPDTNTFKVYGKNITKKSFSVKTDNDNVKAEVEAGVEVEGNKKYLTVKVSSDVKTDVTSVITVYQTDDEDQKVTINTNIWALTYLEKDSKWPEDNTQTKLKNKSSLELRFIIKNYKEGLDDYSTATDNGNKVGVSISVKDKQKNEFIWTISEKDTHGIFNPSTNVTIKFKWTNNDWNEQVKINVKVS